MKNYLMFDIEIGCDNIQDDVVFEIQVFEIGILRYKIRILIHSADPQSRPAGIIVFAQVVRPSVSKSSKTKQSENNVRY